MKKKESNKLINLKIHLKCSGNKVYSFKVGQHTFIKEIENMLAEEIGLNMLRSSISLQHQYVNGCLNLATTLFQNQINNQYETLYATIDAVYTQQLAKNQQKVNSPLPPGKLTTLDMTYKTTKQTKSIVQGLNIESTCINNQCINFNRGIIYPLGFGKYDIFNELIPGFQCAACPYKEQNNNKKTLTKEIKLKECVYTIKGTIQQKHGITSHDIGCWVEVESEDASYLNKILGSHEWLQAVIVVKPLIQNNRFKNSVPLLL